MGSSTESNAEIGPVVGSDEMDVDWFNRTMPDRLGGGRVDSVDGRPIGTGQVGENIRYRLTADDGGVTTVVGKFPSDNEQSFATAQQMGIYASEVGFYRDVAPKLRIRVPEVYYIGFDPATTRFCLVMEDISPAVQGDQMAGTDVATAAAVIDQAVKLHTPTWGRADELAELSWITPPTLEGSGVRNQIIRSVFDGFASRYGEKLNPADIELGRKLMTRLDQLAEAQMPSGAATRSDDVSHDLCLVHQDYRLDNMLFGTGPGAPPVTIVDWQTCRLGSGPADVAYFCGAGLRPEVRRNAEKSLVDRYIAGLLAAGLDIDAEVIRARYVLGSASGYIMAVLASQIVGATDRGDTMFCVMAERHAAQIRDLGLFELLDSGGSGRPYSL